MQRRIAHSDELHAEANRTQRRKGAKTLRNKKRFKKIQNSITPKALRKIRNNEYTTSTLRLCFLASLREICFILSKCHPILRLIDWVIAMHKQIHHVLV